MFCSYDDLFDGFYNSFHYLKRVVFKEKEFSKSQFYELKKLEFVGEKIMNIEHIAMYVNDLEKVKDFFVKYFDAKANDRYHNTTTGFCSYFLSFDDGARLEIMNKPNISDMEKTMTRTGYIHIAFSVGSKEAVNILTDRLKSDGYDVISGPRTTGDGYYESCIIGIEGNQIEITE